MAVTKSEAQITFSTASSVTISSATEVTSDAVTLGDDVIAVDISVYADNQGTPASGDTAVIRIQGSTGDILGDTGDDFDTSEHAPYLTTLDTYGTNTPGEDPAQRTIADATVPNKFRLGIICANAATRNIVFRARITKYTAA